MMMMMKLDTQSKRKEKMMMMIIIKKKSLAVFFKTDGECKTHHPHLTETCGQSGKTKGRLTFTIKIKTLEK